MEDLLASQKFNVTTKMQRHATAAVRRRGDVNLIASGNMTSIYQT
jgi:hypothetical protein